MGSRARGHRQSGGTAEMRTALFETNGRVDLVDDIDIEEPRAGEVLVRIANCGICHSDLSMIDLGGGDPTILGHEAAGTIEAVGPGVTTVAAGDKVLITPLAPCGQCYWCARDQPTQCQEAQAFSTGMRPDGTTPFSRAGAPVKRGLGIAGFSELTVVTERAVVRLEPDTPLDIACVVGCAIQTGVGAVINTAKVEPGATVFVTGLGGIGISVVQGARLSGASKIIVSDPVAERREMALHFGATETIDPNSDDAAGRVLAATGDVGADYAFEAAGVAVLTETCLAATRRGGTTVVVGADATLASASFMPVLHATWGKSIVGTLLGDCHPQRDIPKFIALWKAGKLDLESMVSHRLDLTEINDGLDHLRAARGIRTVLSVSP